MTEQRDRSRADPPTFEPGRRRSGRPSMLRPDVEKKYFEARRSGNTRADSARYAGLAPVTVEKWIRRAKGLEPERPPRPEYVRFLRMDEEARAAVKILVVGNIVARSRVDHNAALAWLRVHGGEEWTEGTAPDAGGSTAPPAQLGPGVSVGDQPNFLLLPREAIPDFVHSLLEARRRDQEAAQPINVTPEPEQPRRNGDSRAARNGLRVDPDPID